MKLNVAVNESLKMQSTKDALALQGFFGKGSTPQELSDFTRAQLQSWAAAARAAGLERRVKVVMRPSASNLFC
jgi:tripartite-type tricarboxylate transporter receptor subunit TctC